ncbi:hypothetical protein [Compostimonas suwonensis]|uniref:Uncharacterized protein n=1 Tax=Compostimonas suwonensis TaxID=1048394 RepID=A0A2M9BYV5_9MICO|nr:hypothetical protein [Compostimonas suwonensis]PJJ63250.1 hypothetical protein CLV54_0908 [Compostimonas suwonensis]
MPWWSWVLIWGFLVLGLLAMLVFFAWWLFRKLMTALTELEKLTALTDALDGARDEAPPERPHIALFDDPVELDRRRRHERYRRERRRAYRRELAVARGKLLVHSDPSRRMDPNA